ncbi:hypothetical protein FALCPG4_018383 [Fusarium falciforme]
MPPAPVGSLPCPRCRYWPRLGTTTAASRSRATCPASHVPRVDHIDLSALKATPPPPGTPSRPGIDATPRGTPAQPKTPTSRVSARPPPAETPSLGLRGLSIQTPTKPAGSQSSTPSKPANASAAPSPGPSAEDHPLPAPKVFKTRLIIEVPGPSSK